MRQGIYFLVLTVLLACKPQLWQVQQATSTKIALDATTQNTADTAYINYLQPFKKQVDTQMNVVIG